MNAKLMQKYPLMITTINFLITTHLNCKSLSFERETHVAIDINEMMDNGFSIEINCQRKC